jgi:polyhydroxyalkanoate synthesis regulator phasin
MAASDTLAASERRSGVLKMPPAKRAETSAKTKAPSKKAAASKTTKTAASKTKSKPKASGSKTAETKPASQAAARKPAAAKPSSARTARPPSATTARRSATTSQARRADSARAAAARVRHAASTDAAVISIAPPPDTETVSPKDALVLTRERIQETLDDAASRGRLTRKDANELVAELVRRGRSGGDEVASGVEGLLSKGREQIGSATKRAARSEPVDRIVRGADRARRAAGVGSSFPISAYADLKVPQVQARLKELSKPELRKVLTYERKHANRKSVVGAIEKSL